MLTTVGAINSQQQQELLVWDSTLGTTACNVLNLPTKYDFNLNLNPPWINGWFTNNSGTAGQGRIELLTLNKKAQSVIITSGVSLSTGTFISITYADDTTVNLRIAINSTATEEYVLDSTKVVKAISVYVSGTAGSFISYIKFKGVS